MSTTTKTELTILFTDNTTRKYNLNESTNTIAEMKTAITQFNAALADSTSTPYQTFVSDDGAPPVRITEAAKVTTTEEVVYNG